MKNLIIASALCAGMVSGAVSAAEVFNYDVTMSAVISQGATGTENAAGVATIFLDDYGASWLAMDMSGSTSQAYFGSNLSADVDNFYSGTFNTNDLLIFSAFNIGDGVSEITSCNNTSAEAFGITICGNTPVGSTTAFNPTITSIDLSDLSSITFNNEINTSAPFVGNIQSLQSFTLTLNPTLGSDPAACHVLHYCDPLNTPCDGVEGCEPWWEPPYIPPSEVPAPAAAWMFGSALAGLIMTRRKNKA